MTKAALGLVSLVALAVPGCQSRPRDTEPFPGYAHILAGPDCPPIGGQAVTLVFRPRPDSFGAMGPQLRMAVWRDAREVSGRTFSSTDRPSTGGGYECTDSITCAPFRSWRVRFEPGGLDSSLAGELEIRGEKGPIRRGHFLAPWRSRVVHCI